MPIWISIDWIQYGLLVFFPSLFKVQHLFSCCPKIFFGSDLSLSQISQLMTPSQSGWVTPFGRIVELSQINLIFFGYLNSSYSNARSLKFWHEPLWSLNSLCLVFLYQLKFCTNLVQVVKLDTDFNLTQLACLRLTKKVNRKLFQITSTLCVQSSFSQNKVDKERQIKV